MQAFVAEAQAMLRAHVLAIGGNALVSYQLNEIVLFDNPHKHQVSHTLSIKHLKFPHDQIFDIYIFTILCTV